MNVQQHLQEYLRLPGLPVLLFDEHRLTDAFTALLFTLLLEETNHQTKTLKRISEDIASKMTTSD